MRQGHAVLARRGIVEIFRPALLAAAGETAHPRGAKLRHDRGQREERDARLGEQREMGVASSPALVVEGLAEHVPRGLDETGAAPRGIDPELLREVASCAGSVLLAGAGAAARDPRRKRTHGEIRYPEGSI